MGAGGGGTVGGMVLPCSLDPWAVSSYLPLFRKLSQKIKQSPLLCPQLPSDPCLHPACIRLLGGIVLLCFISGVALGFKTPNFRDPWGADPCWSSGGGSPHAFAICRFVLGISCVIAQQFEVYGKDQQKDSTMGCCPQLVSLFLCKGTGQLSGAHEVFCPWSCCAPSPKCTPSRGIASPRVTKEILRPRCLFYPPFPPKHCRAQQAHPWWWHGPPKLQTLCSSACQCLS